MLVINNYSLDFWEGWGQGVPFFSHSPSLPPAKHSKLITTIVQPPHDPGEFCVTGGVLVFRFQSLSSWRPCTPGRQQQALLGGARSHSTYLRKYIHADQTKQDIILHYSS